MHDMFVLITSIINPFSKKESLYNRTTTIFILILKDYCHIICINYSHWMISNISYYNSKYALPKFIIYILKIQILIYMYLSIFLSFFKKISNIFINFKQFSLHRYFQYIYKIQIPIYLYLLICSSLFTLVALYEA